MASSAASIVADLIDSSLKEQGFIRKGLSWFHYEQESISVINVQPAAYAPGPYINLGIYYYRYGDADTPDIVECHLDTRLTSVLPKEQAFREITLLDLTNDIPTEVRRDELQALIRAYGIPLLAKLASIDAARVVLSQTPTIVHVAPTVRADLRFPPESQTE